MSDLRMFRCDGFGCGKMINGLQASVLVVNVADMGSGKHTHATHHYCGWVCARAVTEYEERAEYDRLRKKFEGK